jgi:hypothetical protein
MQTGLVLFFAAVVWMWRYCRRQQAELKQITDQARADHAEMTAEWRRIAALNDELVNRARVMRGEKLEATPGPELEPAEREKLHTEGAYR